MHKKIAEYLAYNKKIGDRRDLYKHVAGAYKIKTALYPGSYIDIGPSFYIEKVTYVDTFKGAIKFFDDLGVILDFIHQEKTYSGNSEISFYGMDYEKDLPIDKVDLIISQYAGFVGQMTKKYLKKGGILLCNDSHGDATLAFCDSDYEFIGVMIKDKILTDGLSDYFCFKRQREINIEEVMKKMKGPKYKLDAENYLFRKR